MEVKNAMKLKACWSSLVMTSIFVVATRGQVVVNSSFVAARGEKILQHEIVVNGTLQDVWDAFTTEEGVRSWMVPVALVERRHLGRFHTNYHVDRKLGDSGTIYNTVLSYVPLRMFSMKIKLNESFSKAVRSSDSTLFAVLQFEDVGNSRVRVIESMLGWGNGPEWDKVYELFNRGNAYTLQQLYKRFESGPVVWRKQTEPPTLPDSSKNGGRKNSH